MPTAAPDNVEEIRERLRWDTPFWLERLAWIVDKRGELVRFQPKDAQREYDGLLEEQRLAGKPQRGLNLKARQIGMSTMAQGKAVQRCTQRARYDALTIAHDRETGAKLYRMAETIYANLPDEPDIKPRLGKFRRQKELHFAGDGLWTHGQAFPDSRYLVDTAGEFQAGRGGTYRYVHGSEVAFWMQIMLKLTAIFAAVPDDPETVITLETTANGFNEFKDLWDDAEEGRSDFIAFFWPWWREAEYRLAFASDSEREAFVVGDPGLSVAEEEPELLKVAQREAEKKGRPELEITLEQLNWRRRTIANKCGGDVRIFHQEYPSTPQEAFISTGGKVFDPYRVAQLLVQVDISDPRQASAENPGPTIGDFEVGETEQETDRSGEPIEVPATALWTPRQAGTVNLTAPTRLWLPDEELETRKRAYIVGVDVSGGNTETTRETDYHAIEVIDHRTREQVAEYRSRVEDVELARLILLTALFFNNAWVAIERTGGWGGGIIRILRLDYRYPFMYRPKRFGTAAERTENRYGWDTTQRTKPELVSGAAGLLQAQEDGIKSRVLANEARTYTRTEKGTTEAEPGRFDDCLMAWMIAQQVARELPLPIDEDDPDSQPFVVGNSSLGGYDPRL